MTYQDTEVRSALELLANGVVTLADVDVQTDVTAALSRLPQTERQALWLWGQGYPRIQIARTVLGSPAGGAALLDRAFTHLMERINHDGTTGPTRTHVQRQEHAGA